MLGFDAIAAHPLGHTGKVNRFLAGNDVITQAPSKANLVVSQVHTFASADIETQNLLLILLV